MSSESPHLPGFDQLYVISDIHMGGRKSAEGDFQIFNRGRRLAGLIRHIVKHRAKGEVGLVLNGDIIDSLAEDEVTGYVALDAGVALRMMDRIYGDPSFRPVWDALSELVTTEGCHLILVLGNHDIELALPPVEASIRARLAGTDGEAAHRVRFATGGAGFACRVAGARVFCTHGNEVDAWNKVDFDALGLLGNAMNAGRRVEPHRWKPNAGTRLVVDVMNNFKRRYPFVDLLKPETTAAVGILASLDARALKRFSIADAFPVVLERARGGMVVSDLLSAEAAREDTWIEPASLSSDAMSERLLGASLGDAVRGVQASQFAATEDELLKAADSAIDTSMPPESLLERDEEEGTLGWGDIIAGKLGLVGKVEATRRALVDWLEDDKTFDVDTRDPTFDEMVERVGPEVDFLVTGHTHLARAIEFAPRRYYFNCGTWIRLLRLTMESLRDETTFEPTYRTLGSGRMADLDGAMIPGPEGEQMLVFDRTNVVRIVASDGAAVGELCRVTDSESDGSVTLEREPDTAAFTVKL